MKLTKAHLIHIAKHIHAANVPFEKVVHEDVNANRKINQAYIRNFIQHIRIKLEISYRWQNEKVQAEIERLLVPLCVEMDEYREWAHPFHVRNKLLKNLCIAFAAQNPKFDADKFKSACLKGK